MKKLQAFIIGLFTILIVGTATANAANWTVTKLTNSNDGACNADCSLREAVAAADSGDTVNFSPNLIGQTFTLGGSEIVITKRITIDGYLNNPNVAFISGSNTSRIFYIQPSGGLDLRNITLVQGTGESSPGNPGNNVSAPSGGAIIAFSGSALSLDRVSVRGNTAKFGGAIHLGSGTHHITNSSLTSNSAESGTAINQVNGGALFMSNTTVSGNYLSADNQQTVGCGAICTRSVRLTIRNSTIVNNSAKIGGGIGVIGSGSPTPDNILNIGNTIVAGNTATLFGQDIRHTNGADMELTSAGGNLIQNLETVPAGTFTQPNDITGVNPLLGPLDFYGGFPIFSHSLQAGSPARNGGLNQNAVNPSTNQPLAFDTRGAGFPRIADTTVDIGAFEDQSGNSSLVVTKKADTNDLVCDLDCSLREAVHQAGLNFGTDTITFAPNVFGTITLSGTEILIQNQSVNIVGYTKANILTVSGNNASRIFRLNNATVNVSGMTLSGGDTGANGFSSAIYGDASNLTLDRVMITRNKAAAFPALYLSGGSTQRIINSTISGNAGKLGVGIGIKDTSLFMANTTVSGNYDYDGGFGNGSVACTNGALTVRNSTIAYNSVPSGGSAGIQLIGCALNIGNSIVAQNQAGAYDDIELTSGSIVSVGGNLIGDTNGFPAGTFNQTNDQPGANPMLGALADNGGNVTTLALAPNSPAINTGINGNAVDPFDSSALPFDARGTISRILGAAVDKGAFESIVSTAATVSVSGRVSVGKRGISGATVYLTDQNGQTRATRTNVSGDYRFEEVSVGETYVVNARSKRYQFDPRVVSVTEEISELDFTAQ